MTRPDPIQEAAALAEDIASKVSLQGGDLGPAYQAAETIAREYEEAHGDLDQVLPATEEVGIGFSRGFPSGRVIVRAYAEALAEDVCSPKGSLHKRIKEATQISAASLIGWFLATLGLSAGAASLLAPIAGAIVALGLVAFCRVCKEM
jgi:hypothetical protein